MPDIASKSSQLNTNDVIREGIPKVIDKLGNSHFCPVLLAFLNQLLSVEHISIVQLASNQARFIASANIDGIRISKSQQKAYLTRHFKKDPNTLNIMSGQKNDQIHVSRLSPGDIDDPHYQQFFGQDIKISDRVSLMKWADNGLYCLNIYRMHKSFNKSDITLLHGISAIAISLTIKHTRLAGGLSSFLTRDAQIEELQQRLNALNSTLTKREVAVCSRILLGLSGEGIALDLAIKLSSVQTYRKRAYSKLNICSQNEMFALCLMNE